MKDRHERRLNSGMGTGDKIDKTVLKAKQYHMKISANPRIRVQIALICQRSIEERELNESLSSIACSYGKNYTLRSIIQKYYQANFHASLTDTASTLLVRLSTSDFVDCSVLAS